MARIADAELERLKREVSLKRLIEGQGIWMFNCEKARKKMRHAYPQINSQANTISVAA